MKLLVDVRSVAPGELTKATAGFGNDVRFLITAWQWCNWGKCGGLLADGRLVVVVPDFLYYARLASTGQAKKIAELPGSLAAVAASCARCVPTGIRNLRGLVKGEFWSGAEALLSFDLGLISSFKGEVVLHSNLADFVWVFEREDFVRRYWDLCGKGRRAGFMCQQIEKGMSACARWQIDSSRFVYPIPFNENACTSMVECGKRMSFAGCAWTMDVTLWPAALVKALIFSELAEVEGEYLLSYSGAVEILRLV